MINLKTFIYTEGMRMRQFKDKLDGEEKMYYTIEERQKGKMKTTIIINTCLFISI